MARRNARSRSSARPDQPLVHWYGEQLAPHSLAYVNRELCRRLVERPTLRLQLLGSTPGIEDGDAAGDPGLDGLRRRIKAQPGRNPDITVRHHWPPNLDEPAGAGPLVVCQPWEFGALPASWVGPMTDVVDEVWCYSTYVRDVYERSGIPADKLVLLPLGVDADRFRPDGPRYDVPTDKSVKLLFVGGTIPRKGIDVLLDSYVRAFRSSDDVALVVKGSQSDGVYRGSSIQAELDRIRATDPTAPEIVYLDADLPHDDVAALYRSCDALVHPYRGEGFGLPVAEAMASGLPVVVTAGGATRDFCADDRALLIPSRTVALTDHGGLPAPSASGYSLEEPDGDALVDLLREVASGGGAVERRAEAGRRWVTEHLGWDRAVDTVEGRLLDLAGRGPIRAARPADARRRAPRRGDGVNVVGFLNADFGLGEAARLLVLALERAGIRVATRTVELSNRPGTVPFDERGDGSLPHATTVWAVPADLLEATFDAIPADQRRGRKAIGYWFWESEQPSRAMVDAAPLLDEVWAGSEFIAGAVRQAFAGPVHVVPPVVTPPEAPAFDRVALGLPEDRFTFFFEFDHASVAARKDPEAVLAAFTTAFAPGEGPLLVLKATNPALGAEAHARLVLAAAARPGDVVLLDEVLTAERNHALIDACDVYVSLHRAEGFGLTLAEAMARGKACIATGWSGNLDFMDDTCSVLVPYTLEAVPTVWAYPEGTRWAKADVAAAAAEMRRLATDPAAAAALGRRAAAHVRSRHGLDARAGLLRDILAAKDDRPLLSACLIVKDEEELLPGCLASIRPYVDEVVVYDTGSTDGTVAVARAAGARVVEGFWDDDFGRARNAALAECRGDWILHIDADEELTGDAERLRAELASSRTPELLLVAIDNLRDDGSIGIRHQAVRVFRRRRAHWSGRLHEQVVARPGQPALERAVTDAVVLRHHGYRADVVDTKDKAERNVRLAEADLADAPHGDRATLLLNLARSLTVAGRFEEALARCVEAREEAGGSVVTRAANLHHAVELLFTLGRPAEAGPWIAELRRAGGSTRLADFLDGTARLLQGQDAPELLALAEDEEVVNSTSGVTVSHDLVQQRRAMALAGAGRHDEAAPALLALARQHPQLPVWAPLCRSAHEAGIAPTAIADAVDDDHLRAVLTQLLLVAPDASDPVGEALWQRFEADPRLVAFAVHHGRRCPTVRALEWAVRVRAAGLGDRCPLVARAGSGDEIELAERLRSAAVAAAMFDDRRAEPLVEVLARSVADGDLAGTIVELDELAPAVLGPFVASVAGVPGKRAALAEALESLGAAEQAALVRNLDGESLSSAR